jgi:hypothetical protein
LPVCELSRDGTTPPTAGFLRCSLTHSGGEESGESKKCARVVTSRNAHDRPSQMDDSQRFGLDSAHVGERCRSPSLRPVLRIPRRLDWASSAIWAEIVFKFFVLSFKFSVLCENRMIGKIAQIKYN